MPKKINQDNEYIVSIEFGNLKYPCPCHYDIKGKRNEH